MVTLFQMMTLFNTFSDDDTFHSTLTCASSCHPCQRAGGMPLPDAETRTHQNFADHHHRHCVQNCLSLILPLLALFIVFIYSNRNGPV